MQTLVHLGWLSVVPTILTITLALVTKRVVESLLIGIGVGAAIIDTQTNGFLHSLLYSIPNTFSTIAGHAAGNGLEGFGMVKNAGRGELLISIVLLGSFVSVLDRSGGALDFADRVTKKIKTQTGAMLTAMAIGLSIFTSAYFCILIVGTMMRPIFDRLKISREKLAFYCDAMSAPTKALIPVSGWIAYMTILIEENIPSVEAGQGMQGFIKTMPFNFYCWGMIVFVFLISMKWLPDFGPMGAAEKRISTTGLFHKEGSKPMIDAKAEEEAKAKMKNGTMLDMFLPLGVSVLVLLVLGLWDNYINQWFASFNLPKHGLNSLQIMNLGFFLGILVALVKYVAKKLMGLVEFIDLAIDGGKSALVGAFIIIMAVTLGDMMKAKVPEGLGTAPFLVEILQPYISGSWLPALTFLLSAGMSFATGTSWGTWAILMPVTIPLALGSGMNPFLVAAAVLGGGAMGDHCGPISDTTVLSSIASNTDHIEHVRTQIPYAIAVGLFSAVCYLILGHLV